jgi:hypothetical protein
MELSELIGQQLFIRRTNTCIRKIRYDGVAAKMNSRWYGTVPGTSTPYKVMYRTGTR